MGYKLFQPQGGGEGGGGGGGMEEEVEDGVMEGEEVEGSGGEEIVLTFVEIRFIIINTD